MKIYRSGIYRRLIQSPQWRRLRKDVLTARPWCQMCMREGRYTPAREVHHVRPVDSAPTAQEKERLMFDRDNLMPLCHGCHVAVHTYLGQHTRAATQQRKQQETTAAILKLFGDEGGVVFKKGVPPV